jgi:hypothetical protein
MPEIVHILVHAIYLIILASAHFTVDEWVDVDYDRVITKQSYNQLFRFDPALDFFCLLLLLMLLRVNHIPCSLYCVGCVLI